MYREINVKDTIKTNLWDDNINDYYIVIEDSLRHLSFTIIYEHHSRTLGGSSDIYSTIF